MTRKIIACCAFVLLLSACSSNKTETSSTSTSNPDAMATAMGTTGPDMAYQSVTIVITALNGSGESGTATLTPMGEETRVVIGVKGENTTGKQPAHIHMGTCKTLNPAPKYALKDVVLGKSNTVVSAPIDKLTGSPMAINIHESAANIKKYVACGNIKK